MGSLVIKEEDSLSDPRFPTIFIVPHVVFSSVGTEMLTGDSVVVGWDKIERTGPKDDRQVTVGSEGKGQVRRTTVRLHLPLTFLTHTRKS